MNATGFEFLTYYRTLRDYSKLREEYCDCHVFECCVPVFNRVVWFYIDHTGIVSGENLEGERISIPNRYDIVIASRTVTIRDAKYFMSAYESTFVNGTRFEKQLGLLLPHLSYTELMDQMDRMMLVYQL